MILITGATKGIGRSVAERLAASGDVVLGIARDTEVAGFPGTLFACDLSNADETEAILSLIITRHVVDGILNNVGVASPQALGDVDLSVLSNVFLLNVRSAVQVVQAFIGDMKQCRRGRIVNVCSRAIYGAHERTAYAAANSALVGCTRTWALELAEFGITSNAVAPGPVETELFRQSRPPGSEAEKRIFSTTPMRRLGQAAEAAAIAFLLSDEASFITGQVLAVDSGGSLRGR